MSLKVVRTDANRLGIELSGMTPVSLRLDDEDVSRRLSKKDALLRAVKAFPKKGEAKPYVVDTTAGLGRDTGLFLAAGCRVLACERNEMLAALWNEVSRERLTFVHAEAANVLTDISHYTQGVRPDVIYIDPMFALSKKKAQVTRASQVMRALAQPDEEGAVVLLTLARACAARVVIKRKKGTPALSLVSEEGASATRKSKTSPSFAIDAGGVRYDCYGL